MSSIKDEHQFVSEPISGIQNRIKRKNCERESNNLLELSYFLVHSSFTNKMRKFTFNLSTAITKGRFKVLYLAQKRLNDAIIVSP